MSPNNMSVLLLLLLVGTISSSFFIKDDKFKSPIDLDKLFKNAIIKEEKVGDDLNPFYKDMIASYGYNLEEHQVETPDGYLLRLLRITGKIGQKKNTGKPCVLMHGLFDTGMCWLQNEEDSIAFLLADKGYDVWLANKRGNLFSKAHKTLDPTKPSGKYWDFSLEEHANIDLPSVVEYVEKQTGYSSVNYIGHSQGTGVVFIRAMTDPDWLNKHIEHFVALGTVPSVAHSPNSALVMLDKMYDEFKLLYPYGAILGFSNNFHKLLVTLAAKLPKVMTLVFENLAGTSPTGKTDFSIKSTDLYYYPGGTCKKNLLHWTQCFRAKKMMQYDYGKEENLRRYGQEDAPAYNTANYAKWNVKSLIAVSEVDSFSTKEDVMELYNSLGHKEVVHLMDAHDYNHVDVLMSKDAVRNLYPQILDLFADKL